MIKTRKQIKIISKQTLTLLEERNIPPTSENYSVWYTYFAKENPDLNVALDEMLAEGGVFSDDLSAEIYNKYLGSEQERQRLIATSNNIEEAMNKLVASVSTAKNGANSYGETLESFSSQMIEKEAIDWEMLTSQMLSETRKMVSINETLEGRLEKSSKVITSLKQDLEDMRQEAHTDSLTGIANRKVFDMNLDVAIAHANENNTLLSLLMIDIDHFKQFNDKYGHQLGDQVLQLVARSLVDGIKGRDTAARYGGEEFAVILPETAIEDAMKVAEHLRIFSEKKQLSNRRTGQKMGNVTLTIGVAEYVFEESADEFIKRADQALYAGKDKGRNVVVSQDDMAVLKARLK